MNKRCTKCEEVKDVGEFGKRKNSKDGYTGQCKDCLNIKHQKHRDENREIVNEHSRDWANRNRERILTATEKWRKKNRFKVALQQSRSAAKKRGHLPCNATAEEIEATFTGACDVCGVPEVELFKRLQMDHSHETGRFRGWLCGKCNKALGLLGDSEDVLVDALHYIMNSGRCDAS